MSPRSANPMQPATRSRPELGRLVRVHGIDKSIWAREEQFAPADASDEDMMAIVAIYGNAFRPLKVKPQ